MQEHRRSDPRDVSGNNRDDLSGLQPQQVWKNPSVKAGSVTVSGIFGVYPIVTVTEAARVRVIRVASGT